MKRSEMIRLITMFVNLKCCQTLDEFSGDYLMTLEDGKNLLNWIESYGMLPPAHDGDRAGMYEDGEWEPEE